MKAFIALFKSIVCLFIILAMLFSCENNTSSKSTSTTFEPDAVGKTINLKYTDSGKVKVNLISPLMHDYGQLKFPFRKFPQGLKVNFYEEDSTKNIIIADYAIIYNQTNLVELRDNVKIITKDSTILKTNLLFWDRSIEWLYTDQSYTLNLKNGTLNKGVGFDANQKFTNFISRSNIGTQVIDE
ncbi:MAG: LPS export ABC transporter periplasmic protein LptC [Psychroflexus sp.]|nr:LPS export ABC transporter periplasmic protein LptC [Psychroflexus sp.]MDR9447950.1 LPS export ABC transporter periplasmic protein LptC [Psychroflexus sp.]